MYLRGRNIALLFINTVLAKRYASSWSPGRPVGRDLAKFRRRALAAMHLQPLGRHHSADRVASEPVWPSLHERIGGADGARRRERRGHRVAIRSAAPAHVSKDPPRLEARDDESPSPKLEVGAEGPVPQKKNRSLRERRRCCARKCGQAGRARREGGCRSRLARSASRRRVSPQTLPLNDRRYSPDRCTVARGEFSRG